jgi:hypothetical protein
MTAYDDLETPQQLRSDCQAAEQSLALAAAARDVRRPAPSLRFEDFSQGATKPEIDLVAAARRLAQVLDLDQL